MKPIDNPTLETLYGMQIVVSPHLAPVAVLRIAHDFKWITDDQRAKTDRFLLETFGTKELFYRIGNQLVCSARGLQMIRQARGEAL